MCAKSFRLLVPAVVSALLLVGSPATAGNLLIAFDADATAGVSQFLREYDTSQPTLTSFVEYPTTPSWAMGGVAYVGDIDSDETNEYIAGITVDPIPAPREYLVRGFSPLSAAAEAFTGWTASWPTTSLDYCDYDDDGTTELLVSTWIYNEPPQGQPPVNFFDIRAFEINWGSPILGGAEKVFPTTPSWPIRGIAGLGDPDSDEDWEYVAGLEFTPTEFGIRGFNSDSNANEKVFDWPSSFAIETLAYGDYDDDGTKELVVAFEFDGTHYLRAYALDWAAGTLTEEKDFGWTGSWPINGLAVLPSSAATPGDANLDGVVDDADLSLLLSNWNQDATGDPDGGWGRGEFDGAAPVQDNDLSLLLANWTAAGAVPEPASALVMLLGACAVSRRRR